MRASDPQRRRCGPIVAAAAVAILATVPGCGETSATTDSAAAPSASERPTSREAVKPKPVTASHCPPSLSSCRSAEGRITYVEKVDPDGDGDAHFVILDPRGITLPGLTAIDVRKGLRPDPLPGIGELISAAGPVQTGSYGQSQIHALEVHVAGR